MDCRFESGAMPFGQEHYVGDATPLTKGSSDAVPRTSCGEGAGGSTSDTNKTSPTPPYEGGLQQTTFTADFIAEGLDQTRGRFRTLHIL
ncbi:MAG: hypothetical protein LBI53_02295 [Candidatus Peribacteria bacterium]|jgi:isoleucyl-tRNA synthetase|nr:hypothetical protein [Candidatus Peribacteria bacterium]